MRPRLKEQQLSVESILFNGVGQGHKRGYPFLNGRNMQYLVSLYLELGHCHFYPLPLFIASHMAKVGNDFSFREAGEKAMSEGKIVNK